MILDNLCLEDKYILARYLYSIASDEAVSDDIYEDIQYQVKKSIPNSIYLQRSWSLDPCPVELLKNIGREDLIRKIVINGNAESMRSINTEQGVQDELLGLDKPSRLSFKIDGWNVRVNYYNGEAVIAETRGRGGNFMNADCVLKIVPKTIPIRGKVMVRGELVIPLRKWEEYKRITGNSSNRNSVATALANEDTDYLQFVAFTVVADDVPDDKYMLLRQWGFVTPYFVIVNSFRTLWKGIDILSSKYKSYMFKCDGFVFENEDLQVALRVGAFQEECLSSYVTGYVDNPGMYGFATVCKIKPVVYDGSTISEVSVTNLSYIVDNDLRIGYPIAFSLRSHVVAVLNVKNTEMLHNKWCDRYDEFREYVDKRC